MGKKCRNKRLLNQQFFISCEGECEKYYFERLQELINSNKKRKLNCKIEAKKKSPKDLALGLGIVKYSLPFMAVRDIEDNSDYHKRVFHEYLSETKECKTDLHIKTFLVGYSNFTFELWMILHKRLFEFSIPDRTKYLEYINSSFKTSFSDLAEYKKEDNFKALLNTLSLDDVYHAIKNARISRDTKKSAFKPISYCGVVYDSVDPATNIDELVEYILEKCF